MAHTYALGQARTASTGNPITFSYSVQAGDTIICLLLNVMGGTDRAGGSPTWGSYTFTQRNTVHKAAVSPEASAEFWDILNPFPGTATITIPNTSALTVVYTVAIGRAAGGGYSAFMGTSGGNATSTNPTPGAVTITDAGGIGFAITAGGWNNWLPTAQTGTVIANSDEGSSGGEQYVLDPPIGQHTLSWTFATSDDWGAISTYYKEIPPRVFNNYQAVKAADGISVGERIR